jgi:hypothetical protein
MLQLACGALHCSRLSFARYSSRTPCSVHSLFVLCISWKWLLFVLFVLCRSSFGSDFEVTNGHGVEKKEVYDE